MKAFLLLSVLLTYALAVAAQYAVEAAPQAVVEDKQVVENEVAEFVPEAEEPVMVDQSVEGRFFTCPSGWERYKSGCYLFDTSTRSWSSAAANCRNMGGSLASVRDVFEYSFMQDMTRRAGHTYAWLGGFYFQTWRWVDQSPFSYSYWSGQYSVSYYQCIHINSR
ncbi:hypothetical protein INR49_013509, partial [Caranx melampygus]